MAQVDTQVLANFPTADGTDAYLAAMGVGGATQAAATARIIPLLPSGLVRPQTKPSGLLTFAEAIAGSAIRAFSAGTVTWTIPPMCLMTYPARSPTAPIEMGWLFRRMFTGTLLVTPSVYRGEVASQAAMIALSSALPGDWVQRSDLGHLPSVLKLGGAFGTAADWVQQTGANRPRIAWGAVANQAAMLALSNAQVGDWCTRTDDSGNTYHLLGTASGPNYYATAANWILRSDALKPVTPQIYVNWNNMDPATMAMEAPGTWLESAGVDYWVAS